MSANFYQLLGVASDADLAAIKRAYRRLAKGLHPDLNPGDAKALERFKDVARAYEILSDPATRALYDRGEIDASGNRRPAKKERPRQSASAAAASAAYRAAKATAAEAGDFAPCATKAKPEDVFSRIFKSRPRARAEFEATASDHHYTAGIGFFEAARGVKKRIALRTGKTIELAVPPGARSGQVLRLKGQGEPGFAGAKSGDALVTLAIEPHRQFRRDGDHVYVDVEVTLEDALRGSKLRVPTLDGAVTITLPKGMRSGTTLRLPGKGVVLGDSHQRGDQYVTVRVASAQAA